MTRYRDTMCDPYSPITQIDHTAAGILAAVTAPGVTQVSVYDVDAAVIAAGGHLGRKSLALKALRNSGISIHVYLARQNTWYELDAGSVDRHECRKQEVHRRYSEVLSRTRMLAGQVAANPSDHLLAQDYSDYQAEAVRLGTSPLVGYNITEVALDLAPL
jgi:hypothetical protein